MTEIQYFYLKVFGICAVILSIAFYNDFKQKK